VAPDRQAAIIKGLTERERLPFDRAATTEALRTALKYLEDNAPAG
jgi:hypothetical protein